MTRFHAGELAPKKSRALFWKVALVAAILAAGALSNAFSAITDYSRLGESLPEWEPFVWEFSSAILTGALIPGLVWLNRRVPVIGRRWYRSVPVHLLATLPFSIVHVAGMVGLRKLVYVLVGGTYTFGPLLPGWIYEYRKDFVTYWMIIAFLCAFAGWRHWRKAQAEGWSTASKPDPTAAPAGAAARLDRLVVRKFNREFILDVADIARLESAGNYVTVHANATAYQLRGSLAGVSQRLDRRRFVQIHRSQVVNVDHIREIQPWDHGDYRVLLNDGSLVNFSRRYRGRLEQLFDVPVADQPGGSARP